MSRRFALLIALCFALILGGCVADRELESGLDSKQSIEMLVLLTRAGISADREKLSDVSGDRFRVVVPSRQYTRAIELLHEYGLPQRSNQGLEEFLKPKSFVPDSPELIGLRLDHALGLQIERHLSLLPGVVDARTLVRSNLRGSAGEGAAVSVVLRYVSASSAMPFSVDEVRSIVAGAVPGVRPDAITVKTTRIALPLGEALFGTSGTSGDGRVVPLTQLRPFFVFRIPEEDLDKARRQLLFYTLAFCFAGGLLGAIYSGIIVKRRMERARARQSDARKSFFIEAAVGSGDTKTSERLLPGKGPQRGKPQKTAEGA